MATKHQVRSGVVSLLYAYDFGATDLNSLKDELLEELKIRNKQKEFAEELLDGILNNLGYIDEIVEEHSLDRKLNDIGKIEKAILRVGVYELKFTSTTRAVVINEAIQLAQDFGIDEGVKFINGLLDSIDAKDKKNVESSFENS
jgi:N utilization substance protein B